MNKSAMAKEGTSADHERAAQMQPQNTTSLSELHDRLVEFRDRRDWKKYHRPKDLALSVSIESAELLELFQWKTDEEIETAKAAGEFALAASDEIADVLIYLLLLAGELGIDPLEAAQGKIARNELRFPATGGLTSKE
jgi:NTP pyrophosphatase (non-canonical NTP hydrolase)